MAGSVSAQPNNGQVMRPEPAPVAGFSPNFADPQPITGKPLATLEEDANRLVRWQGWLDIDAFSTSILNQIKKKLDDGDIQVGSLTIAERAIAEAVTNATKCDKTFQVNEKLFEEDGVSFEGSVKDVHL